MAHTVRTLMITVLTGSMLGLGAPAAPAVADSPNACPRSTPRNGAGVGNPDVARVYWGNKGPTLREGIFVGARSSLGYVEVDGRADPFWGIFELRVDSSWDAGEGSANGNVSSGSGTVCAAHGSTVLVDERML